MLFMTWSWDLCPNDDAFGPIVHGCRDSFDFTLLFEQTFLSIAPSSLFIVLAVIRIVYLRRQPRTIAGTRFQVIKIVGRSFQQSFIPN